LKYLKKEVDNRRSVIGRKFGCSKNLEYVNRCQFIADDWDYIAFKKLIQARPENVIENDFFTAYFSYHPEFYTLLPDKWKKLYIANLDKIRNCA
jgi:hypothetical protein